MRRPQLAIAQVMALVAAAAVASAVVRLVGTDPRELLSFGLVVVLPLGLFLAGVARWVIPGVRELSRDLTPGGARPAGLRDSLVLTVTRLVLWSSFLVVSGMLFVAVMIPWFGFMSVLFDLDD